LQILSAKPTFPARPNSCLTSYGQTALFSTTKPGQVLEMTAKKSAMRATSSGLEIVGREAATAAAGLAWFGLVWLGAGVGARLELLEKSIRLMKGGSGMWVS
jgi:hypothetical protein